MTEQKARKRQIRARMAKTGERYSAARRNVTKPEPLPPRVAEPEVSDAAVRKSTGKAWDQWFRILDAWDGTSHTHSEIARYLNQEQGVGGWWAQSVTVGYERARGMRATYQRPDGFCAYVSKSFPVEPERLYRAFADARQRNRWLERGTLKVRPTKAQMSLRFDFRDGPSRTLVFLVSKGPSKTTAAIQHERLPDMEAVEEMRAFWKGRLKTLSDQLAG